MEYISPILRSLFCECNSDKIGIDRKLNELRKTIRRADNGKITAYIPTSDAVWKYANKIVSASTNNNAIIVEIARGEENLIKSLKWYAGSTL